MSSLRKTVLFVDDDPVLLTLVQTLMRDYSAGTWNVLTAESTAQGLAVLRDQVVDLLVTDIHMPVVDGIQFLKLLQRKYPNVLKVALTGDTTSALRPACLGSGAELYLEKPRTQNGWQAIYATLNELVKFQPEEGFRGVLKRVGLTEIIQLECLASNSSVLEVKAGGTPGSIYIEQGRIVHAIAGARAGEDALYFLLSKPGGEFDLRPFQEPPARTIADSWEGLLMEAARKRDEYGEGAGAPGSPEVESKDTPGWQSETAFLFKAAQDLESGGAPSATSAGGPAAIAPASAAVAPRVEEFLLCSVHGEVLYQWQCANAGQRILFLEFLSQKSRQLAQGLPVGFFDRLELGGVTGRIITHIAADRALFLRTVPGDAAPSGVKT